MKTQETTVHSATTTAGKAPRVSVIVPTYNVAAYVRESIESLLTQTFADAEIILVDDGSTDQTLSILRNYGGPRCVLIEHDRNRGIAATRNTGIKAARGEYIAFLDADDIAEPNRLEKQVAALDADPSLGMIGSHVSVIDEYGNSLHTVWHRPVDATEAALSLLYRNTFSCVMMVRRSAIPDGGFGPYSVCEDYDFNARIAQHWKVRNLDAALTRVRIRRGGLTHTRRETMMRLRKEIMRAQLSLLDIEPTERELDINTHIGSRELAVSRGLLDEVERWLLKLSAANRASGRFDQPTFDRVLAREWYVICKQSTSLGLYAANKYRTSPMALRHTLPVLDWAKLLVKSAIRRQSLGSDYPVAYYERLSRPAA